MPIVGDVKKVLRALAEQVKQHIAPRLDALDRPAAGGAPSLHIRETRACSPQYVIRRSTRKHRANATIVTGVGQHQMWAGQHYFYNRPRQLITSGGLGTMGFELPAAIGAQVALPRPGVWSICGDGGFQMTLQELATSSTSGSR